MPELPEVEYTRRLLQHAMAGARIERVLLRRASLRYPFQPDLVRRLARQRITAVERRAKYLLVSLASGAVLLMHLGMSGAFRVLRPRRVRAVRVRSAADDRLLRHDHLILELSGGRVVVFNDPRRFGYQTRSP